MIFGALQISSACLLLIGVLLLSVSLISNYWSFYHLQISYNSGSSGVMNPNISQGHRGLFELCHDARAEPIRGYHACINRFTDFNKAEQNNIAKFLGTINYNYESWDLACLVMMVLAVSFGILSLFIAPVCCHSKFRVAHGVLVLFSALNGLMCIIVYGAMAMKSSMSMDTTWQRFDSFGWGFFVGIIASLVSLLAAILFIVGSCIGGSYRHYESVSKG